ncbi:MAG: prepilin peptidase [Nitrospirae bacterium]|nr:prepilin peptidase [Nitrospirota bacterium]
MQWPIAVMTFVLGAVIGSFLNVCIYRLAREESIVWPGSRCPKCSAPIAFYDNLPIISFLFLLGRCRKCRAPISWRYPLVEALNGAGYLLLLRQFGLTWPALIYAVFFSALVVVTFIDLDIQIIPDVISLPGIVIGLAVSHWLPQGVISSLIGVAVGGGFFWLVAEVGFRMLKQEAMGGGDIKLIAMIGAFLGWQHVMLTIFLASLTGSAVGLVFMLFKGWGRKTPIPFGPFLALGALLALFLGAPIVEWYVGLGR